MSLNPKQLAAAMARIKHDLLNQDNRCTADPVFQVQILVAYPGFPEDWYDEKCWYDPHDPDERNGGWIYDDPPEDMADIEGFSYRTSWKTVAEFFTLNGAEHYMKINGHNVVREAHDGKTRIYVDSMFRNNEMNAIRQFIMETEFLSPD